MKPPAEETATIERDGDDLVVHVPPSPNRLPVVALILSAVSLVLAAWSIVTSSDTAGTASQSRGDLDALCRQLDPTSAEAKEPCANLRRAANPATPRPSPCQRGNVAACRASLTGIIRALTDDQVTELRRRLGIPGRPRTRPAPDRPPSTPRPIATTVPDAPRPASAAPAPQNAPQTADTPLTRPETRPTATRPSERPNATTAPRPTPPAPAPAPTPTPAPVPSPPPTVVVPAITVPAVPCVRLPTGQTVGTCSHVTPPDPTLGHLAPLPADPTDTFASALGGVGVLVTPSSVAAPAELFLAFRLRGRPRLLPSIRGPP